MRLFTGPLAWFFLPLTSIAWAQSNLPDCNGTDITRWSNCYGTGDFVTGHKYVDEWQEGKPNGQGTFTYVDGSQYIGQFRDGKFNGKGTFTSRYEKYVGEFKGNRFHGRGIHVNAVTGVSTEGIWAEGGLVTTERLSGGISTKPAVQQGRHDETSVGEISGGVESSQSIVDAASKKCRDLGLKSGTEKFGECVLRLSR